MTFYNHILFATDLSETNLSVANKAAKLAELFGAKMSIVHVIEPIPAYGYPGFAEFESPYIDSAKSELAKLVEQLPIKTQNQSIVFGSVKSEVITQAKKIGADLIVVGSHGRHGLMGFLGSNANAILNGAKCDVTVLHCSDK